MKNTLFFHVNNLNIIHHLYLRKIPDYIISFQRRPEIDNLLVILLNLNIDLIRNDLELLVNLLKKYR